jgi:hypothetical protein
MLLLNTLGVYYIIHQRDKLMIFMSTVIKMNIKSNMDELVILIKLKSILYINNKKE